MRSADGFLDAVTGAVALTRGDLGPAAANAGLVGADYFSCDAAGTPPEPTRPDSGQFLNAIVEEFQYILDLGDIDTPTGQSMDPTDNAQLAAVLVGAPGIYTHISDTGVISNAKHRTLIASDGVRVTGSGLITSSASASSATIDLGGVRAFMASCRSTGSGSKVSAGGTGSGILNCFAEAGGWVLQAGTGTLTAGVHVDGAHIWTSLADFSVLGASFVDDTDYIVDGTCMAVLGTYGPGTDEDASYCAVLGSVNPVISGAAASSALLATTGCIITVSDDSAVIASKLTTITANRSAAIGCEGGIGTPLVVSQDHTVCLASTGAVPAPAAGDKVYGGYAGARTWSIDSVLGGFYSLAAGGGTAASAGAFNMGAADFAEYFRNLTGFEIPGGSLVTRRRQGAQLASPNDTVLGVVSAHPGVVGNATEDRDTDTKTWTCVALTGQVPVRVDASVTNDAIDAAEANGHPLYVGSGFLGIGCRANETTRVEAMEMIGPGICMCLVR